ncbi:class I SAM-dependent methyltransferase [Magnetospira sp. QH-2]|uniref:class I SAM-dependent methyltransferase n=1 Tax=Magnetospira sp. (strain QH-2) TaxID=1288970 RepID=UPI0003E80DD9|nr:class I SAM-dependent methyltransferase [Magnetospira sp. QH-2]CCQ75250.1 conserved protein of unknown function [Magnetospira sp. QH-2]
MGHSSHYGKVYTALMIGKLAAADRIGSVVDCGCGSGTYKNLLGPLLPRARWIGVEVWEPNILRFGLEQLYDEIIPKDLRDICWETLPPADLAIFGDVLEHMPEEDAVALVTKARQRVPYILLSIPVVSYPQGAAHDNPYEVHVKEDWDHGQVSSRFSPITSYFIHDHIGVYFLATSEQAIRDIRALQPVVAAMLRDQFPQDIMAWGTHG